MCVGLWSVVHAARCFGRLGWWCGDWGAHAHFADAMFSQTTGRNACMRWCWCGYAACEHLGTYGKCHVVWERPREDAKALAYCTVPEHQQLAPWCNIPWPACPITPHQFLSGPSMFCANLPTLIVVMLASFFSAICRTHGRSISRHHDTRLFGGQRRAWPPRSPRFARVFSRYDIIASHQL